MQNLRALSSAGDDAQDEHKISSSRWQEIEEEEDNMLIKLEWPSLKQEFLDYLEARVAELQGIVAQHLPIRHSQECTISQPSDWMQGDFNVCIPVSVNRLRQQRYLIRCPFPHMFSGADGIDEKIRCEAASYAWMSQRCPRVPIPHLWGFGVPDGSYVGLQGTGNVLSLSDVSLNQPQLSLGFYEPLIASKCVYHTSVLNHPILRFDGPKVDLR